MQRLMSRLFNIGRLVGVVVGIPWMLVSYVGWCLPRDLSLRDVGNAWTMGDLDPSTVVKALACALWVAWALAVVSVVMHVASRVLHVRVQRPRIVPKRIFVVTGRWVGGVALSASTTVMGMGSAMAATNTTPLVEVSRQLQTTATATVSTGGVAAGKSVDSSVTNTTRSWTVRSGDTLWEIAEETFGDGTQWRLIADANPSLAAHRDELPVGLVLTIPHTASTLSTDSGRSAQAERGASDASEAPVLGTVTVAKGDHFWKIADDVLTDAYGRAVTDEEIAPYWRDMVALNRGDVASGNVNLIFEGEQYRVQLPELPTDVSDRTITTPNPVERLNETLSAPTNDDAYVSLTSVPVTEPEPVVVEPVVTTPAVAATSLPAQVPVPPVSVPVAAEAGSGGSGEVPLLALAGLGLSAVGAGALLLGLRRRRAIATRTREVREALEVPSEDLVSLLSRIRAVGASDVAVTIDGVQRLLRRQLMAEHKPVPVIAVVRAGRNGVELLLDSPDRDAPQGFVSVDEGQCWVLSPDVSAQMLDDVRAQETSLMPALVSVGSNEIGSVLVDVERLGALEIRCDDPHGSGVGVLASMAAEFEGAPWLDGEETEIFGIGLPRSVFEPFERLRLVDDGDVETVVRGLCDSARNEAVHYPRGKHVERAATSSFVFSPKIVLVGPDRADVAKALAEAALHTGSGLCVVALDQLPPGSSSLVVTGLAAVLEPYGLDLDVVAMLSLETAAAVGAAVDGSDNVVGTSAWPSSWDLQTTTASLVTSPDTSVEGDPFIHSVIDLVVDDLVVVDLVVDDGWGHDGDDIEGERFVPGFEGVNEDGVREELRELSLDEFVDLSSYDSEEIGSDPLDDPDRGPDGPSGGSGGGSGGGALVAGGGGGDGSGPVVSGVIDSLSEAEEVLAELLAPTGTVVFRMLSDAMPTVTGTSSPVSGKTAPRCVELLTFLGLRAPAPMNRVLEAMWPLATETRTVVKAVSRIRGAIAPANILLDAKDRYVLDGIDSDWDRFLKLVDAANMFDSRGAVLLLRHALGLVVCRPFEGRKGSSWEWLDVGYVESDVRVRIVDASESLAELALAVGDASLALWACEKARLCEPHREATHQLRMRAYAMLGDRDALHREVKHAQASAMIDDPFAEISTNMKQLLRVLESQFTGSEQRTA